ncbi:SDR family NAD(P)-dependent oxidoreductase [Paraburkholderia rhizosphaerae]|uniref:3-hydroxybutyrate dehydrogenase n=1 Tax=Paraburkholderia rhizosphaerae TaxID=480658 RepID=A0A4R8LSI5_9BURK|nr:SDR family NAD(P)-dependent oxidoreductase [Paraburkholderia rhizosphaerae]TDY50448.1 3-hydroxybutyrate dehydrogenase [Paraburkholderia rhizosphaerae]
MNGKTALVTGSSHGLGLAMADALAAAGCRVVLHGVEPAAAVEPVRAAFETRYGVAPDYIEADLATLEAVELLINRTAERTGSLDILVNNAVVRHFAPIDAFPVDKWEQALAVNLSAAFHAVRLSLPRMRERGWGRIFNMTSVYGMRGTVNRVDYVTTKSALLGLTRAVAAETVGTGITCNAICPGAVHTPTSEKRIVALMSETGLAREPAIREFLRGKQPSGQFVEASHVAQLVVFLCGEAAGEINGAMLPVEGGWLAT